jgi:DNA (cytosine-5)-methyltransferase 1
VGAWQASGGPVRIAGLFAGIGGIELGFHQALGVQAETVLLCESWEPAQAVLRARFPGVPLDPDVRTLRDLPAGIDVLAAGFPCTDLSQAGRTAGMAGDQSSLVAHVFQALRLAAARGGTPPWLLIENVPNMLALDRGHAMRYVVDEVEALGYRWAYRVVDSRFTGSPQRRRRVIMLASASDDPRSVLFADDAGPADEATLADDAFGFYWTEGRGGLGWARDAVPTLKGGSTIGIPSPPAIWVEGGPPGRQVVTPRIEDAEALQGFPRDWTRVATTRPLRNGPRWKLVGNAVTVGVAAWVAQRLASPGAFVDDSRLWQGPASWPTAAWGEDGKVWQVPVSEYPRQDRYRHLLDVVDAAAAPPLSHRGTSGFLNRLQQGRLGRHPGFREAIARHASATLPDAAAGGAAPAGASPR